MFDSMLESLFFAAFIISIFFLRAVAFAYENEIRQFFLGNFGSLKKVSSYQIRVINVVLKKHNFYYRNLSSKGKGRFINRVATLLKSFDFVGKKGQVINTEIKALICSAIAQATFGWKVFDLDKFYEIQVYPSTFRLSPHLPKMQGASHPKGIMVFSWEHLVFGFSVEDDGINLALHEIAHALKINYLDQPSLIPNKRYKAWNEIATRVKLDMELHEENFFRKRAKQNMHEFFAVCLENFFERPQEFLKHHPKLYAATCLLLNQNPLNSRLDYKIEGSKYFN